MAEHLVPSLVELYLEPGVFSERCTGKLPLRVDFIHRVVTHGHGARGGEGEIHGESNLETYITICKLDSQREFSVWLRKLKRGLWINLEE